MTIYLVNSETNQVIASFDKVITWGVDFVEHNMGGCRTKMYCAENEYFTDKEV